MKYNIYDSKILAPSKCGSRYLDTVFDVTQYGIPKNPKVLPKGSKLNELIPPPKLKEQFFATEWSEWEVTKWSNIEWIVIRPAEDLTLSAINTELLLMWNSGITLLSKEREWINDVMNVRYGHYDPTLFKQLYFLWSTSKNKNNTIKFIHLKDLTKFTKEHFGFTEDLSNNPELHDFSNFPIFMNKLDALTYFKKIYPNEWSSIQNNMISEIFFWELIQKNCDFYVPSKKLSLK
jgi:hypothetical protein